MQEFLDRCNLFDVWTVYNDWQANQLEMPAILLLGPLSAFDTQVLSDIGMTEATQIEDSSGTLSLSDPKPISSFLLGKF